MMLAASDGHGREKKNHVSALVLMGGAGGGHIMHYDAWQWGSGCQRAPSVPYTTSWWNILLHLSYFLPP